MKAVFSLLAFAGVSMAHSQVAKIHINGEATNDCLRMAENTNPIMDINSPAMACGITTGNGANKCPVKPGDEISFEWRSNPGVAPADVQLKDGTIPVGVTDDSHRGPCAVYMKKVTDATTADAPGDGWFKVSHEGVTNGDFCTDRIRKANAPQPASIPEGLEPGDYLLRAELITLNDAASAADGGKEEPQFYLSCAQVTVQGTSGTISPDTVSIPGYLKNTDPGMIYNIWWPLDNDFSDYVVPGPAPLATGSGGGTGSGSGSGSSAKAATTVAPITTRTTARSSRPTEVPSDDDDSSETTSVIEEAPEPTTTTPSYDELPRTTRKAQATVTTFTTVVTRTTSSASSQETTSDDNVDGDDDSHSGGHGHGYGNRGNRGHRARRYAHGRF